MAHNQAIEEQTLPFYHRKCYYPVKIGQTFNNRYRIIAKLGYGAYSTVWLAWDERANEYASPKVSVQTDHNNVGHSPVLNEINMLRRLKQFADEDHPGLDFTRLARDIFETESLHGLHYCIAYKPQGNSVRTLQETFPNAIVPKPLVKSLIHRLFFAVNWLHATCGVAHTDISPQNVLIETEDDTSLRDVEDQEARSPSLPITSTDNGAVSTIVYPSKPTMLELSGHPISQTLVKCDWSKDTLELLEGRNLFDPIDRVHGQYVLPLALAQYIGYLGPPPLNIIQQSALFSTYFDAEGNWVSEPPIPKTSLEDFVTTIPPGEEKDQFLQFIRKILTWDPDVRATANEIIPDEWLMRPVEEML
ncbi:protein kinase [Penicillium hispanicum]|uniref:protein kinase n=1 Tax=Penicillium hispanicum TaxID=1080232 RepID=UPI00253FF4F1|nr:protein kinase [Penicillium hispanicum]KAJ5578133.1 protein kinase [Penicillium hispanicum]